MILKNYNFGRFTFQDPIHGSIHFGPIEKEIIDHLYFQRLHGLRQNSLLYLVFPAANHTRFDHSLGVMFLADKFLDAIIRNQNIICEKTSTRGFPQSDYRVNDSGVKAVFDALSLDQYYKLLIRAAALFHDIGHGPFSHLFKNYFPRGEFLNNMISGQKNYSHLRDFFNGPSKDILKTKIEHEHLSCLIATKVIHDCEKILDSFGIDPEKFSQDICSLIEKGINHSDQISGFRYKIQPLLNQIISGIIDVDRMDYLLRDSHMCGVNYGLYEPDRILKSMCAYAETKSKSLMVAIRYSALGAFEDFLFSRYQMHKQIYGHKTNRACSAMLERIRMNLTRKKWNWYENCNDADAFLKKFTEYNDSSFIRELQDFGKSKASVALTELIQYLFIERKLVKRVFEEISDTDNKDFEKIKRKWKRAKIALKENGIWAVGDEYVNKGGKLDNNSPLKVLKKSASGDYLVKPLNEFRSLVQNLPKKEITFSIFCKRKNVDNAKRVLISKKLIQ